MTGQTNRNGSKKDWFRSRKHIADPNCTHDDYFPEILGPMRTGDVTCRRCGFTWNPKTGAAG